jgi:hypothetical protein
VWFHVVDGQQRLTTIVLFLNAIRRALLSIEQRPELSAGICRQYLWVENEMRPPLFKLQLGADVRDFWERSVLSDVPGVAGPTIRAHYQLTGARDHFARYI